MCVCVQVLSHLHGPRFIVHSFLAAVSLSCMKLTCSRRWTSKVLHVGMWRTSKGGRCAQTHARAPPMRPQGRRRGGEADAPQQLRLIWPTAVAPQNVYSKDQAPELGVSGYCFLIFIVSVALSRPLSLRHLRPTTLNGRSLTTHCEIPPALSPAKILYARSCSVMAAGSLKRILVLCSVAAAHPYKRANKERVVM